MAHDRIGKTSHMPGVRQIKKGLPSAGGFEDRLCHRLPIDAAERTA
jgi:hypothetical protein